VYINWILANYAVLVNNNSILILFYENIISNPQHESGRLSSFIQLPFEIRNAKKTRESVFSEKEYTDFQNVVSKFKLNDMWQIILKEMNTQNVNYSHS
jgi:hypothetical protein